MKQYQVFFFSYLGFQLGFILYKYAYELDFSTILWLLSHMKKNPNI